MSRVLQAIEFFVIAMIVLFACVVIFIDWLFFSRLWGDIDKVPNVPITKGYSEFLLIINSIILGAIVLLMFYSIFRVGITDYYSSSV